MEQYQIDSHYIRRQENFLCGLFTEHAPPVILYLTYLGGDKLQYHLWADRKLLFTGKDFRPSPFLDQDSIESIVSCLSFLLTQPGDTDKEYFEGYNRDQIEWLDSTEAEELRTYVGDFMNNDDENKEYHQLAVDYFTKYFTLE